MKCDLFTKQPYGSRVVIFFLFSQRGFYKQRDQITPQISISIHQQVIALSSAANSPHRKFSIIFTLITLHHLLRTKHGAEHTQLEPNLWIGIIRLAHCVWLHYSQSQLYSQRYSMFFSLATRQNKNSPWTDSISVRHGLVRFRKSPAIRTPEFSLIIFRQIVGIGNRYGKFISATIWIAFFESCLHSCRWSVLQTV